MTNTTDLPVVQQAEYDASTAVTLEDLASAFSLSRITTDKRLKAASVVPVAKLSTGKAGRPPSLFPRNAANEALAVSRTQAQSRTESDAVAQAAADALAE